MKEEFNEILSFCISSAIGCIDEPPIYGPLRLIEVMEKLIDFGVSSGITSQMEMNDLKRRITDNKTLCMVDEDKFKHFLRDIAYTLVDKQIKLVLSDSDSK